MATKKNPTFKESSEKVVTQLEVLNATLTARLDALDKKIDHQGEIIEEKMKPIQDHEKRIRNIEESLGALKTKYDLITGGSFAASLAALLKQVFGL